MNSSSPAGLRFAAALSTQAETAAAVQEVCAAVDDQLGAAPDLMLAFVTHHHGPDLEPVAAGICDRLGSEALLCCTGESIVGNAQEIEERPALALWAARMPGVTVTRMHLEFERTAEGGTFVGWPDTAAGDWPAGASLLLLGEPFSFPADVLLARLNDDRPGVAVFGGMASGAWEPGKNRLLLGRQEWNSGAVAALIQGPVRIRNVVSQGCRPIGRPLVVTKAQRNILQELSGKPAMAQLRDLWQSLPAEDQARVQSGLHVGIVVNEYQDSFGRGDFLVRNVVGADPEAGVIAIGDYVRVGQTVQFHVRDAESADEDLQELLSQAKGNLPAGASGALLFTCNGRGSRLFDQPHHDAQLLAGAFDQLPAAGFFAQGEIGPIGGKNFLHGFTASVVLFGDPE